MIFFTSTIQEVLNNFSVNASTGLKSNEVNSNKKKYGINKFKKAKPTSILKKVIKTLLEPINILLLFSFFITFSLNCVRKFYGSKTEFIEAFGILFAVLLSTLITVVMERKSSKIFSKLSNQINNTMVKVIRGGKFINIHKEEVVVGDIVYVETGGKIPSDGRLIESAMLKTDESSLTGETEPVKKDHLFMSNDIKTPIAERANMLYGECFVTEGNGTMVVTEVGYNTEFGKIAKELSKNSEETTPLQDKLTSLGKIITIFGLIISFFVFFIQFIYHFKKKTLNFDNILEAFISSVVLLVAAVPEGLPTIVAASLGINMQKMSKQNALVKNASACETIGSTSVICSDKTGTLTENKMVVTDIFVNEKLVKPENIKNEELAENFCINSTSDIFFDKKLKKEIFLGNSSECALLEAAKKSNIDYKKIRLSRKIIKTFPFCSKLKYMTTIIEKNKKYIAYSKGSPEKILSMCENIPNNKFKIIQKKIEDFQNNSCRVLAFSFREFIEDVHEDFFEKNHRENIEKDMIFCGFAAIRDPIRKDVYDAVKKCKLAGINIKMMTGDNILTALSIARELKIIDNDCDSIEAKYLEEKTDEELKLILPKIRVIARSTPSIKKRVVSALKAMGEVVAVTGDGINDAPAIKDADVGIAMGITGTEVSKEASDIVLLDDSFSTIVKSIEWGRNIYENFQRFIQFQLTINLSSIIFILFSMITDLQSPFTALEILWINIIMDGPPALVLGLMPMQKNHMSKPPIKRKSNIITKSMCINIISSALFISCLLLSQKNLNFLEIPKHEMSTVIFALFVVFQIFSVIINTKIDLTSIFKNMSINITFVLTLFLTFFLQIIITEFGKSLFGTSSLNLITWLKIVVLSSLIIIFSEAFKGIARFLKLDENKNN